MRVLLNLSDDDRKAELSRQHEDYVAYRLAWQILLDAFEGRGGFLDGSYLWPYPREEETAFQERQGMARYHNYIESLVDLYVRQEFTQGVKRTSNNAAYNAWIEDVDGHGTSLNDTMRIAAAMGLVGGHCGILVDKTSDEPTGPTRADETARPFATIFPNISVLDWRFDRSRLTGVKLREAAPAPAITQAQTPDDYRTLIWDLDGWARFDAGGELVSAALTSGLALVPLVIFRPKASHVSPMIGRPLVGNANILRALFNRASEEDEVLRSQAFSLLTVSVAPEGDVSEARSALGTVGAAKAIVVKGAVDYKTPSMEVPTTIRENMAYLVQELYRAAHVRFRRDSMAAETAEAIRLQHIEMNEMLQGLGQALAKAERDIARLYFAWTEPTEQAAQAAFESADPRAEYPDEFFITELATDLEAWGLALEMDLGLSMSKRIKKRAVRRIEPDIASDELAIIDAEIDAQTEEDMMQAPPPPTDLGVQPEPEPEV